MTNRRFEIRLNRTIRSLLKGSEPTAVAKFLVETVDGLENEAYANVLAFARNVLRAVQTRVSCSMEVDGALFSVYLEER